PKPLVLITKMKASSLTRHGRNRPRSPPLTPPACGERGGVRGNSRRYKGRHDSAGEAAQIVARALAARSFELLRDFVEMAIHARTLMRAAPNNLNRISSAAVLTSSHLCNTSAHQHDTPPDRGHACAGAGLRRLPPRSVGCGA